MRFVLRADASPSIGFGHVSRMLAIAEAIRAHGGDAVLVTCRPPAALVERATAVNLAVHELDHEPGSADDLDGTRSAAGTDAIVIADGYRFSNEWLASLGSNGAFVVYVDDRATPGLLCDVVVNPNVSGAPTQYERAEPQVVLAGPEWSIVADAFRAARATKLPPSDTVRRVLVTMGGSDPTGETSIAIAALSELTIGPLEVRVIVGASNARIDVIRSEVAVCRSHVVEVLVGVDDMAAQMTWADVAVTASGVTTTELACIGVPAVTFAVVDNQDPIALALEDRGMFRVLPSRNPGGASALANALEELAGDARLRRQMFERQRATIDGNGKERVVERVLAEAARPRRGH